VFEDLPADMEELSIVEFGVVESQKEHKAAGRKVESRELVGLAKRFS